jgi:hypothetical protein
MLAGLWVAAVLRYTFRLFASGSVFPLPDQAQPWLELIPPDRADAVFGRRRRCRRGALRAVSLAWLSTQRSAELAARRIAGWRILSVGTEPLKITKYVALSSTRASAGEGDERHSDALLVHDARQPMGQRLTGGRPCRKFLRVIERRLAAMAAS